MKKLVKMNFWVRFPRVIMKNFEGETEEEILEKAYDYLEGLSLEFPNSEYEAEIYIKKSKPRIICKECGKSRVEYFSYTHGKTGLCGKCYINMDMEKYQEKYGKKY